MTETSEYVPKVGERIQVVLEGEVFEVRPRDGYVIIGNPVAKGSVALDLSAPHVVSVTRVRKPPPTEPGYAVTVTRANHETQWIMLTPHGWFDDNGDAWTAEWVAEQDWRIVSVPVQDGHKVLDRDYDAVQDGEA